MRSILAAFALLCLPAWSAPLPCAETDRKCGFDLAVKHVTKRVEFWSAALALPLEKRIGPAPPELVELLTLDNIAHGYPNRPRVSQLPADFTADVLTAFAELPSEVRRLLGARLVGIYFADDIGGTGFTDETRDADGKGVAGFVVLDPTVLMPQKANAWATWKDSTPFKPDPAWTLRTQIEPPARDDRIRAIQYILLHELGHVLSIGGDAHPSWNVAPAKVGEVGRFPFFAQSWRITDGRYSTPFEAAFPQRKDVVFYFGAKLDAASMKAVYDALERTNFPTLYAATHPGDDFAESFASYVHVVMMKRPYQVRIENAGKMVKTYGACWDQPRCAGKRRYLEDFLGR